MAWVLTRSLWTHLRVCWDITESRYYLIASHIFGWGAPILFTAICLKYTGVSYRLTIICLPNDKHTFATYFGWMIAFASLAFALQMATSFYCLYIYLLNLWKTNSSLPSRGTGTSSGTGGKGSRAWKAPRQQAWARVRKIFILQWRNISLCLLVTAVVAMLSGVFVSLNTSLARDRARGFSAKEIAGWAACLVITQDKNRCLPLAKQLGITEAAITASLIICSLAGCGTFALLVRWGTIKAWYDLIRNGRKHDEEDFLMIEPRRITFEQPLASEAKNNNDISPIDSPVSAFFPSSGTESSSNNRYSDSLGGASIQHRLDSDASVYRPPGARTSVFLENTSPIEEKPHQSPKEHS